MVIGTAVTQLFWNACTLRDHLWHRRAPGAKLAAIRSLPGEAAAARWAAAEDWGPATRGIVETGPSVTLNIHSSVAEQADWLVKVDPDYLAHLSVERPRASPAHWAARRATDAAAQSAHVWRTGRAAGRAAGRDVWGLKLVDMYSSQEVGYLALQCPDHEHYHVQAENVLVEVLDDDLRPCTPGQVGRIVVTALHNFAVPLLRYDIGDYAEVGSVSLAGVGCLC